MRQLPWGLEDSGGWGGPGPEAPTASLTCMDRDMGRSRASLRGRPFFFFSTASPSSSSLRLGSEEGLAAGAFSSLSLLLSRTSRGRSYACNTRDLGLIPGLGRSPGEGKGYPLQYSALENSMDLQYMAWQRHD